MDILIVILFSIAIACDVYNIIHYYNRGRYGWTGIWVATFVVQVICLAREIFKLQW